ncbi:hypothetical protein [Methanothrix sp.]|uniref:hypothetical protein n=1 Tax=Methanothrix sp. TaxID=90426 RepID=UPI001BD5F64A
MAFGMREQVSPGTHCISPGFRGRLGYIWILAEDIRADVGCEVAALSLYAPALDLNSRRSPGSSSGCSRSAVSRPKAERAR